MNSRRFHVQINLRLEAVTCPGVWLCSHGYLELTIKGLGYYFRTGAMDPYFPLLCHDHFKMEGYFKNSQTITDLIKNISREYLEITLWQNSRRLAYYEGTLMDLVHHVEPKLQCPHGNTRLLLMKATPAFPGILAPKVEITSNFVINDKMLNFCNTSKDLRTCTNMSTKHLDSRKLIKDIKNLQYQRPCTLQAPRAKDFINKQNRTRKQKTVCHTRKFKDAENELPNAVVCTKPQGRRVSIASTCSSGDTHTSVGICDIEHDCVEDNVDEQQNHEQFCELCRLYKEVFLI